jgi:hypothetical protein
VRCLSGSVIAESGGDDQDRDRARSPLIVGPRVTWSAIMNEAMQAISFMLGLVTIAFHAFLAISDWLDALLGKIPRDVWLYGVTFIVLLHLAFAANHMKSELERLNTNLADLQMQLATIQDRLGIKYGSSIWEQSPKYRVGSLKFKDYRDFLDWSNREGRWSER